MLVTPIVIRVAGPLGALDHPGPRKIHLTPIPRIGGVAVFFGFIVGLIWAAYRTGTLFHMPRVTVYWVALAGAASCLFLLGFIDDVRGVSYRWKFAVQILAASGVWIGGFRIDLLSLPLGIGDVHVGIWSLPLTVLWIVGVTNALNLIDGLDGLAAGIALITTTAVAVIALYCGQRGVVATSIALVGSLAGFLRFNLNPARIFLGDSGSMFLGFVLAVISIRGSQKGSTAVAVLAPLLVLGLPLLDTLLAMARRGWSIGREGAAGGGVAHVVRNAHRVFLPDRGHLHHRLLDLGISQRGAVAVLYGGGVALALGAAAGVIVDDRFVAALLLGSLSVLVLAFVALFVARKVRRDRRAARLHAMGRVVERS